VVRARAEPGHQRELATVFGTVTVTRIACRAPGAPDLHPADAALSLPEEKHSAGLRKLAAVEAARGSFEQASAAIERASGVRAGKRQVEALASAAAADVPSCYAQIDRAQCPDADLLVLTFDGKGIVMRSFFDTGDPDAEAWVADQATKILDGKAAQVAAGIRRRATRCGHCDSERKGADAAANYLTRKKPCLDYATALANGWPIATGVIEGACRHLVKTEWTSPAPAGACKEPRPSSPCEPSSPTATSTPTGATTSTKNTTASTTPNTNTPTNSQHDQSHLRRAAPVGDVEAGGNARDVEQFRPVVPDDHEHPLPDFTAQGDDLPPLAGATSRTAWRAKAPGQSVGGVAANVPPA
jgi:hypothetical protein